MIASCANAESTQGIVVLMLVVFFCRVCVNITAEPSDDKWFCPRCVLKNLGADDKKKRGRKPKAGRGRGKKKAGF